MKVDWLKIIGIVCLVSLLGLIGFGAWNYYFHKPIPVVNTYTAPVTQIHNEIKAKQHLMTGAYLGRSGDATEIGLTVGWLW